jgi:hypothetical protein
MPERAGGAKCAGIHAFCLESRAGLLKKGFKFQSKLD